VRFGRLLAALAVCAAVLAPAGAATPNPTSVTIAGDLQSELGCSGDWDPACAASHLTYDANDDVWQGTFAVPAGSWNYKAALNDGWDENYGLNAVNNGANIPLVLAAGRNVKFYYDHKSHWATDNVGSTIVVAPGSFQSELGCSGDWDPSCLRSWLQDVDGDGTYTLATDVIPAGNYEAKAAIDESWDVNYGAGGTFDGANIPFTVPPEGATVTFSYVNATHVLTITVVSLDTTDPTISGQRTPAANGYGWDNTDVVVSFTCNDNAGGSGVDSVTAPVTLSGNGAGQSVNGTCTDKAGNSASTSVSGISIDKVAPTVTYSGNAGTYTVDQQVVITCTPGDSLSGIAGSTCANVNASAASLGLGPHTLSATATDKAGNTGAGSTIFTVVATPASLCRLTEQLVRDSAKYGSGGRAQRAVADGLTTVACAALRAAAKAPPPAQAPLIGIYKAKVSLLAAGGWLTPGQATTLRSFADALLP